MFIFEKEWIDFLRGKIDDKLLQEIIYGIFEYMLYGNKIESKNDFVNAYLKMFYWRIEFERKEMGRKY